MSGHNKWSQIKRKKEAIDAKRSKIFSKFSRLITLESKRVNGNTASPSLKAVIDQAKSYNMSSDNIKRATKKGTDNDTEALERVVYEAYGPEGIQIIINGVTSSRNKASGEIRHILSNHGGSLGTQGSVLWAFTKSGENYEAVNPIVVSGERARVIAHLIEELEDNSEVQNVYTNANFDENFEL
jgi:YebC/PmpR family DNA-binding regulatory protein